MEYTGEDNLEIMADANNYNNFLIHQIIKYLPLNARKILDFGAGTGFFAKRIEEMTNKEIICLEPADNMQKFYKDSSLKHIKSIDSLENNEIDFVYSLNVLEHIEDDYQAVKTLFQKISKNTNIFIYVPAFQILYSNMDKKVEHKRRYSRAELMKLFKENNFIVKKCIYADFLGFFASFVFKFIGNKNGNINPKTLALYDKLIFPISRFLDIITLGRILGKNLILIASK